MELISDYQQSVFRPLAGAFLIPLLEVADYVTSGYKNIS